MYTLHNVDKLLNCVFVLKNNTLLYYTMPNRSDSFQKDKLTGFLDVMEQMKPINGEGWNEACHLHNKNFLDKHHTANMLR
jgi:hypothetical protein